MHTMLWINEVWSWRNITFINGSLTGNLVEPHNAVCSSIWATPVLSIGVVRKFTENALLSSLHAMCRYLALVFLCTSRVASISNSCSFRSSMTCQAWWGEVRAAVAGAVESFFLCSGINLLTWANLAKLLIITLQQTNDLDCIPTSICLKKAFPTLSNTGGLWLITAWMDGWMHTSVLRIVPRAYPF